MFQGKKFFWNIYFEPACSPCKFWIVAVVGWLKRCANTFEKKMGQWKIAKMLCSRCRSGLGNVPVVIVVLVVAIVMEAVEK